MSLPRYPAYKDSGVEWLGNVPAHWQVDALRRRATLNPSKSEIGDEAIDGLASFLPMEAVGERGELDLSRTRPITEVSTGYTYFREGDVAFAKITPCFENGKGARMLGLHGGLGFGTTELTVVRPQPKLLDGSYLDWVFRSAPFRQRGEAAMYGAGGQKRVPDGFVREFVFAWPCMEEQNAIAAFLDRETAKIDALIAEQEKLLALLAEKRQATISHAVTRGLDPNAPMKDSGIPWLSEVPAHWEVVSLKNVVVLQRGHDLPADAREDGEVPVVSSGGYIGFHNEARASGPGIVTGRYGSIGSFVYVEGDYWPLNTALYSVALHGNDARYVWYVLQSVAEHFVLNSMKSAVPGVDRNDLHTVAIVRAPNPEQKAIVIELDAVVASLDGLSRQSESAIVLLKERRSALIAAAVTGQIDVRGVVESEAA